MTTMKTTRQKTLGDRRRQRCHQNAVGLQIAAALPIEDVFTNLTAQTVFLQGKATTKYFSSQYSFFGIQANSQWRSQE